MSSLSSQTSSKSGGFRLSFSQHLSLLSLFLSLPFSIGRGVFALENRQRTWRRAIHDSVLRTLTSRKWDDVRVIAHGLDELEEGAALHWIGPRRYDRVILYFHGGGFSLPPSPGHLELLHAMKKDSKAYGGTGVVLLEYSLTPDHPFPTQLRQANAALTHLLVKGAKPSDIILSGDSAGGTLALQLFAHILKPLPSIPPPPALSAPLRGAALISPWTTYGVDSPSFSRNDRLDGLSKDFYQFLGDVVLHGVPKDELAWAQPLSADFAGLDKVVTHVLNIAGEAEGLLDPVNDIALKLERAGVDVKTMIEAGGMHEDMINNFSAGEGNRSESYRWLTKWLAEVYQ
ncbi:hypothetical protein EWM64_g6954 [Hericium alpestre]|uniref:Alpha/beta hydrolase fold-3 domain-containing protein n=1 Tax=Hericium alpestre TaxID=135208 RepID=A0A4Y9ZU82_9AGAM|nr:hypothetical protein EWM64_g6954 [Hericium alpestre]